MNFQKALSKNFALSFIILVAILLTTLVSYAQETPKIQKTAEDHFAFLPVIMKKPPVQTVLLFNGDFEQGNTGWQEYSYWGWTLILQGNDLPVPAKNGSWGVWLGGDDGEISYIRQNVAIPNNMPFLTYWHWIAGSEFLCGWDFGGVGIDGNWYVSYDLCEQNHTGGWVQYAVDMSEFRGQTINLDIVAVTDEEPDTHSNLFIDVIEFNSAVPSGAVELNAKNVGSLTEGPYLITTEKERSHFLTSNLNAPSKRREAGLSQQQ